MQAGAQRIVRELIHHLPYSAVGVGACLAILLGLEKMGWAFHANRSFHLFHPAHIFLSAVVTTAMFWKYERRFLKTILIGFFGTLPICTISDIAGPYLGGWLLNTPVVFHLCLVEEPWLVYPACFLGIAGGMRFSLLVEKLTEIGHLTHVMVSSLASLLYLVSFSSTLWSQSTLSVFVITLLAVWIPCCLSDIVFPLVFVTDSHPPCCGHHPHKI